MYSQFSHQFVDSTPAELEDGIIYVSVRFRVVVHLCACGCKNKVVTPLRPAKWRLTFDGDSISLLPSIGNWQFPCRSHYLIVRDKIQWSTAWSDEEIAEGRARDSRESRQYYAERIGTMSSQVPAPHSGGKLQRNLFVRGLKRIRKLK